MMTGDFDQDTASKTSPVYRPSYDFDFSQKLGIQSPTSAPILDYNRYQGDRVMDFRDTMNFDDILVPRGDKINNGMVKNAFGVNTMVKKRKRIPLVFKPFVTLESTELVARQIGSLLIKQHK